MPQRVKKTNTKQVAIETPAFNEVLPHILKYHGHIGKFFSIAAQEKMKRDLKKMEMMDTGND